MFRRRLILTLALIVLVFFLYLNYLYRSPSIDDIRSHSSGEIKIYLANPANKRVLDFLLGEYHKLNDKFSWKYVDSLASANLFISEDLNNTHSKITDKNLNYRLYYNWTNISPNHNNTLVSLPVLSKQLVVISNLDLAKEYGLSGAPNTWDGVIRACEKINNNNLSFLENYCINLGGKSEVDANILSELTLQNIGDFGKIKDNLDKLNQSIIFFNSFTDVATKNFGYDSTQNALELFNNKKLTYLITDSDNAYQIHQNKTINTAISPLPQIANNTAIASLQPLSFNLLNDRANNKLLIDFMRFSLTEDVQNNLYQDFFYLPVSGTVRSQFLLPLPLIIDGSLNSIHKIFFESFSSSPDKVISDINIKIQALSLP